ncbi:hydroxymethylpyrimidine/phosphomethylpyrimidine kinase [Nocardioides marinisabuli]|uniref:Hydroxymethylpyrimidine/phosphomethylpyrimidine kinase n=1 Tax=Nocardioides marinisabuli TaxID=419476 RepID=A0A7Y9JQX5_9ACTN|nr:hydroxymethylpyrimidine/phosphomethylpyrimidine kinase [Nocardioides marinisabuli]
MSSGTPPVVLSVAGTDSGGAAGTAADLTTFAALGAHGACVVTAVTAQDTTGVRDVHAVPRASVAAQLDAVLEDLPVAAAKTGMLGTPEVVRLVAERLGGRRLVVDPVLVATSGAVLGGADVARAYVEHLLPVAAVATPNADEAAALLGRDAAPHDLASALADLGCAVVVTGGPDGDPAGEACTDWLALPGHPPTALRHPALRTTNDHGTGCTFSAALAVALARAPDPRGPADLEAAVAEAASHTLAALHRSRCWDLGRGRGPIAHTFPHPTASRGDLR